MPRVHEFDTPEFETIEILELTATEVQRIAEQASRDHPLDIIKSTVIESKLKRLQCARGYTRFDPDGFVPRKGDKPPQGMRLVDLHVSNGDRPHDILGAMTARATRFCDAAVDHVHDIRSEEMAPFFGTRRTTEI